MRHYFSTQADLFAFCMSIFLTRVQYRVESMELGEDLLQGLQSILLQFLPLDEDRRMEMEVWLSFNAKTLIHPALQSLSKGMYEGIHKTIMFVLNTLIEHKLAKENLDPSVEAYKLNAIIDGLAMHLITQPQTLSKEMAKHILSTHLQSLCKVEGGE
ncbi:transcriptional regulator BetI [compost metagenome]